MGRSQMLGIFVHLGACVIAKDEQKLDVVARQCVFVGYGNEVKGHRLYDPRCSLVGMSVQRVRGWF